MPRVVDHEARRRAITEAVWSLASSGRDLSSVTFRAVAKALGSSTSTVTHYYSSREEMLEAAFVRLRSQFQSALSSLSSFAEPEERLWWLLLGCLPGREPHYMAYIAFSMSPAFSERVDVDMGELRSLVAVLIGDRVLLADAVLALADGIAVNALMDPSRWPLSHQEAVLWEGLAAMGVVTGDNS